MKTRSPNPLRLSARSSNLLGICTVTWCVLTVGQAIAQSDTWDGGAGSGLWSAGTNWVDDSAPAGAMLALTFAGNTETTMNNDIAGISVNTLDFTNNGLTTNTAAFTLSGNSITLNTQNNAIRTTAIGSGGTSITDILSLNLSATGIRQFNIGLGHDLNFTGILSGTAGSLSKGGLGTLILGGSNTYTGLTYVDSGILKLGAADVLPGTGLEIKRGNTTDSHPSVDLNGFSDTVGAITFGHLTTTASNGGGQQSIINTGASSAVLTLGGNITYRAGTTGFLNGQATISANIATGNANRSINVGNGAATDDLVISGGLSGSGIITKQGSGVLLFSGANSYTGQLNIDAGTVKLGANNTLPNALTNIVQLGINTSTASVVFDINGFSDTVGPLRINGATGGNPTVAGHTHSIIDSAGGGVLTLGNTFNVYAGGANQYGQATISANLNTGDAARNLNVENSTLAPVDLLISGVISGVGNGFNMAGAGTTALSNANTYSGDTRTGSGVLLLQNNLALQNSALNAATGTTGTLSLDTGITSPTLGGLKGTRDLSTVITSGYSNATSLTLKPVSGSVTYDGIISNGAAGMILNKTGAGTQVLTNTHSYTGGTNINEGTLVVNGSISTSILTTVASGATITGDGITGALTVQTGGFINPGNSPGILDVNGNYTQAGLYTAEVNGLTAGSGHDQINVTGTVNITGGSLSTIFTGTYSLGDMIFILLNDGVDAIAGTYTGFAQGATVTSFGGFDWQISYLANSGGSPSFSGGNDIALMAIPEPDAAGMLIGGVGVLALLRRRRA
ncbi:MAG: autotransporter-associated beta strand repeat-containing protein [Luteolibacter sp.]